MKAVTWMGIVGCILAAACRGCGDGSPVSKGQDNDSYLKLQLLGTWDREYDSEPVIFEKTFNTDGTVILKEFRKSENGTIKGVAGRYHRSYKADLPLCEESKGTWDVQNEVIYYNIQMPDGNVMHQQYKVERVSANEFVQSSANIEAKVEETYVRANSRQFLKPATSPTSR